MLTFAPRPQPRPEAPNGTSLDVAALQALAAEAGRRTGGGRARRGPFRPEVWLNARQRHNSRLAAYWFRGIDVLVVAGIALATLTAFSGLALGAEPVGAVLPLAMGAFVTLSVMKAMGLYGFRRGRPLWSHLALVTGAALAGGAAAWAAGLALGSGGGTLMIAAAGGASLIALLALHVVWTRQVALWRVSGVLTPNVVVVGATRHAQTLIQDALERRDLNVLGVFDDRLARAPDSVEGVPVLGDTEALLTHPMTPYVDHIVVAVDPAARDRVRELMRRLGGLPNDVTLLVDPKGSDERGAALEKLARAPLASLTPSDPDRAAFNKRLQDLILGGLMLIGLTPVMALIGLLVRLDSPGPILFRQRRHGFNNEEIVVWKFRTMRHEAADHTAARQVTADDDRITRVGRFLRSTSLDELPQLVNVLKGEMSLVGPRPHAIGMKTGQVESARLVAEYAHRHRIKPGMTGWAAVKGSRGPLHTAAEVRRRVQLDVEYVERQSFWLDLWIIAVTVPVLLGDRVAVR